MTAMEILRRIFCPGLIDCIILAILFLVIYIYNNYKLNYWQRKGIHQLENTNKIVGDFKNAFLFRTAPGYHLGDIYQRSAPDAPYVGFYIFHKPCLLLKDPQLIKQILIRDFNVFCDRHFAGPQQKDSIGMKNLFGLKNPAWRYLRRKMSPIVSQNKMKQMFPTLLEACKPMMDYLQKHVETDYKGAVIDVQDVSFKYTSDIIASVALATKTDSFAYPDSEYSKCLMNFFHSLKRMVALVTVFFIPEVVDVVGDHMLFDLSYIRDMFFKVIESREKSGEVKGDFIDAVIQMKNGEHNPVYKLEGDNLFYQAGTFFSGFESSAIAASFTLLELARNKKSQDLARESIKNGIDKHGWTYEAFNEMKYLDQCISEALRLHPSISTLDRYTLEDYKIPDTGVVIEKGTPIYISLYGLHGDPRYFEEPKVFKPERFNDEETVSDAYLPFGAGPRQCIAFKLGQLHVKIVLARILSEYEVYQKSTEVNKLDSRATLTTAADGINLKFLKLSK